MRQKNAYLLNFIMFLLFLCLTVKSYASCNHVFNPQFMEKAIDLSKQNIKKGGGPFGAVIVNIKNQKIISEGTNLVTSTFDPTAHAEMVAIRNAAKKLKRFHLEDYVIYTSTEPCPMCLAAIYWAHLKEIFYVNTKEDAAKINFDDKFIYDNFAKKIHERAIKMTRINDPKALEVFKLWEETKDKTPY